MDAWRIWLNFTIAGAAIVFDMPRSSRNTQMMLEVGNWIMGDASCYTLQNDPFVIISKHVETKRNLHCVVEKLPKDLLN